MSRLKWIPPKYQENAAMSFKPLVRISPLRWALYRLALWRIQEKLSEISPFLNPDTRVLDIGAGNCVLCQQLRQRGYDIVPVDLANLSFVNEIVPVVYDGTTLPFDNDSFDVAMVITVLHHVQDPDAVLAELKRVARRLIVIEEIYENSLEKYFTYLIDSLFNLEFINHPHSNRTDDGWRAAFQRLGLSVVTARYSRSLGFLRRVTYHLVRS
jgi:2-polyprenyl-3-methyl-5-hydroxy-6-metoxy-1,4-benzoquinol methylase